jgi:hypothetical protein
MVSFQSLKTALSQNPHATIEVLSHRLLPQPIVESFKLPTIRIAPTIIPRFSSVQSVQKPKVTTPPRAPSPARSVRSDTSEYALPPPTRIIRTPKIVEVVEVAALVPSPAPAPALAPASVAEPASGRQTRIRFVDPICLAIERTDSMYSIATHNVQQSLECEEARRLEARIGELYKEESGRSRGWVKTKLEAFFLPRAAVGSRVNAKDAFAWEKIWTDKEASAILDFVCLAKGIRLAVWKEDKVIGLWPAADSSKVTVGKDIPLVHVGSVGNRNVAAAIREGWRLVAPISVEHGLEKLTLDELDGLAEKMGIAISSGKKGDKVRALASARMAMRI